jgi:hypothetical protein
MYRITHGFNESQILNSSVEEIPSGGVSVVSDEDSDSDPTYIFEGTAAEIPRGVVISKSESDEEDMNQQIVVLAQVPSTSNTSQLAPTWNEGNLVHPVAPFTENVAVADHIKEIESPTHYALFSQFFADELVDLIVFQTNLYCMQIGKPFMPSGEEIRVYLGISLYMGITRKPSYRDYWSNEPDLHDSYVSQLLPVKRFSFLLSHIHLNDNLGQPSRDSPNYDKLYNIRPLLDSLSQSFSECYLLLMRQW